MDATSDAATPPPDEPRTVGTRAATDDAQRVLRRSVDDRVIGGVCGGIARYFGVDSVLVRLLFVVLALAGGAAVLAYIVLWIVIPEAGSEEHVAAPVRTDAHADSGRGAQAFGLVLVVVGTAVLIDQFLPGIDRVLWPIAIIGAGILLLVHGGFRR